MRTLVADLRLKLTKLFNDGLVAASCFGVFEVGNGKRRGNVTYSFNFLFGGGK